MELTAVEAAADACESCFLRDFSSCIAFFRILVKTATSRLAGATTSRPLTPAASLLANRFSLIDCEESVNEKTEMTIYRCVLPRRALHVEVVMGIPQLFFFFFAEAAH